MLKAKLKEKNVNFYVKQGDGHSDVYALSFFSDEEMGKQRNVWSRDRPSSLHCEFCLTSFNVFSRITDHDGRGEKKPISQSHLRMKQSESDKVSRDISQSVSHRGECENQRASSSLHAAVISLK